MITVQPIHENRPPQRRDNLEEREKIFTEILKMEVSDIEGLQFFTNNISAFKVALNGKKGDKKFTFKKVQDGIYKVWRYL